MSSSEVLVCSKGSGHALSTSTKLTDRATSRIREKARLLTVLRDAGIHAEMMPAATPSLTDEFAYANSHGIPWLVIFDVDEIQCTSFLDFYKDHLCELNLAL